MVRPRTRFETRKRQLSNSRVTVVDKIEEEQSPQSWGERTKAVLVAGVVTVLGLPGTFSSHEADYRFCTVLQFHANGLFDFAFVAAFAL